MEDTKTEIRDFNWKLEDVREKILKAMRVEAAFDGWTSQTYEKALQKAKVDEVHAQLAFPKGAIDVAVFMHTSGDQEMLEKLKARNEGETSMTRRIENAVLLRLEIASGAKEAVKRAASVFALPMNAKLSADLIWGTADAIWKAMGDDARGFSHYSKRMSLGTVYSSSFLYFLQDDSENMQATREFVARRIQDVGNFGKFTAKFKRKPE